MNENVIDPNMPQSIIDLVLTTTKDFNDNVLWGPWTMIFIAGCAVFFTVLSGGFQFRKCVFLFKNTFGRITEKAKSKVEGRLSPFQAATTALAGTVGNGNIVGVATALSVGGAGAIFWMWLLAFLGMMLKTAEITLSVHYRHVDEKGNLHGGPMYYMKNGLGWHFLVPLFCFGVFSNAFLGAAILQPHTVGRAFMGLVEESERYIISAKYDPYLPYIITAIMSLLTGLVVIGGIKRIGKFCSKLVPLMSLVYIVGGVVILVFNFDKIPSVFAMIIEHAFAPAPAAGGFAGAAVIVAIREGISKGMYSNEAGQGTAPMAHATADTGHPFQQGIWGAFEVFIDTIIICTITAFAVLSTGVLESGETGVELVIPAFSSVFSERYAGILIFFCTSTFCLSTQIGFFVYYETSIINISRYGKSAMKYFKWIYLVPGVIFAGISDQDMVDKLWAFATISAALCALPNLVAVLALSGVFKKLMNDYMSGTMEYATEKVDKLKMYIRMPKHRSYFQLGMINCFVEMVACGVKRLALSPPVTPDEYERIREDAERIVAGFGMQSYLEKSLLVTGLQTPEFTEGKWSILYYEKDEVLEQYLALKEKKGRLEADGVYDEKARREVSRAFMQLLSYPEEKIEQILVRENLKDPYILLEDESQ